MVAEGMTNAEILHAYPDLVEADLREALTFAAEALRESIGAPLVPADHVGYVQTMLAARVAELEEALTRVRQLRGLLPICSYCKKIRDDRNYWQQVEQYVSTHTDVQFSHGICPDCYRKVVEPQRRAIASTRPINSSTSTPGPSSSMISSASTSSG
jgi:hypothetical protein